MFLARRRHLMVLPGALVAGHLAASVLTGHQPVADLGGWGTKALQALVCVGFPLAGWAGLSALRDGWRGHTSTTSPLVLVFQQVLAFVGLDLVEHALAGTDPLAAVESRRFWVTLAIHAAAGALAWVALRLATRMGQSLARRRRSRAVTWASSLVAQVVSRDLPASVVALSSLSRRGPPIAVPAPHLS